MEKKLIAKDSHGHRVTLTQDGDMWVDDSGCHYVRDGRALILPDTEHSIYDLTIISEETDSATVTTKIQCPACHGVGWVLK